MTVEFLNDFNVRAELVKANASDLDVCRAAWVSQAGDEAVEKDATEERQRGLINFLYRNRHMSPFEHGSFTFFVKCPIFVAREFHRHRTFSYNEVSGRYTELKPQFYIPPANRAMRQTGKVGAYTFERGTNEQIAIVTKKMESNSAAAWYNYKEMLAAGVAKEVARMVLPLNIFTSFYATCNPRNLMQFLDLRTDKQAMYEIACVAHDMSDIFRQQMPMTYEAWNNARD